MHATTRLRTPAVVLALAALLSAATGTTAATAAGGCAHPGIRILDTLGPAPQRGEVMAFGRGTIAAGNSAGVPAYWIGTDVLKVPLPARYGNGTVTAVNRHDLMVGTVHDTTTDKNVAFSYRIGAARARILPGGSYASDVNDSGLIVGGDNSTTQATAYIWHGTAIERTFTVPADYDFTTVTAINNQGTVVGAGSRLVGSTWASAGLVWSADPATPVVPLLPIDATDDNGLTVIPEDIDENGRIVGETESFWSDGAYEMYWDAPYTADGTRLAGLPGYYGEGYFRAISPTSGVVVGEAPTSYYAEPGTAEIWTGSGPIRALPTLNAAYDSGAQAVADNGNAGGYSTDADGVSHPVIWTCAPEQGL
ncbi:hypothetical protein [Streptomyces sp. NPDC049040]|uniref:hypothetical protein n=1 Tax=Streptomyces sp. NPDC049040 TaxID=3365593 RepID=UPI003721A179